MKKGLKEFKELIDGLELLAVQAKKIADGGIGAEDIIHMVKLAQEFEVLREAFKGFGELKEEMKDLDQSEVIEIVGELYGLVKAVEQA